MAITCADDGETHRVRDDIAAVGFVFGGQVTAVCGHKVTPAPLLQRPHGVCELCVQTVEVLGLHP